LNKNILLAAAAIGLGMASTAAAAEEIIMSMSVGPSVTVSTGDLNLDSTAGVAGLKNRVRTAAAELCQTNAVEPVDVRMARIKCYRTAISTGNRQIDRIVAEQGLGSAKTSSSVLAGAMR
jgi:UrcA family protein